MWPFTATNKNAYDAWWWAPAHQGQWWLWIDPLYSGAIRLKIQAKGSDVPPVRCRWYGRKVMRFDIRWPPPVQFRFAVDSISQTFSMPSSSPINSARRSKRLDIYMSSKLWLRIVDVVDFFFCRARRVQISTDSTRISASDPHLALWAPPAVSWRWEASKIDERIQHQQQLSSIKE